MIARGPAAAGSRSYYCHVFVCCCIFPLFFGFLLLLFGDDRARRLVTLLVQLMFVCFFLFVFLGYALTLGPSGGVSLFVCSCCVFFFL